MGMYGTFRPMTPAEIELYKNGAPDAPDLFAGAGAVSVEKMWHALHFILTGTEYDCVGGASGLAIFGGEPVGPDHGSGPARMLTTDQVREVANALQKASFDELWKRFDRVKMDELRIYPQVWDEDESYLKQEIQSYFDELVRCYAAAADAGKAMLLVIY